MFKSIAEIVDRAEAEKAPVWRVVLAEEVDDSGRAEDEVLARLKDRLQTMREAVLRGLGSDAPSVSGLLGGGARRFDLGGEVVARRRPSVETPGPSVQGDGRVPAIEPLDARRAAPFALVAIWGAECRLSASRALPPP